MVFRWQDAPQADFAVIGDPVAHSMSPRMHQAAYQALGLQYRYVAIHVRRGEVFAALDRLADLGYRGVNVTVPHKEEALLWSTLKDPLAERLQAANTIRNSDRSCVNTDLPGFWDTIADLQLPSKRALLLGAGGSARSVALALVDHGFELSVWNRTPSKALALTEGLGIVAHLLDRPTLAGAGLVVNTTSASLQGESLDVDWPACLPDALAYDLMYRPSLTPFLEDASREGLRTMDGRPLLAAQGARSFEYWLGIEAPRNAMLAAIA